MAKKIILALIILILVALAAIMFLPGQNSVNIFIDGENVSVQTTAFSENIESLNGEICEFALNYMNVTDTNTTHLYNNITSICEDYGLENAEVSIDSSIGKNQVPIIAQVSGNSMNPTLQDGQKVLVNKTHDIHIGDIVVAQSPEYGGIIKRVADIDGDSVYLVSDNKQVSYEYINGALYELKGITTWVDISNIEGVVIDY